MRWIQSGLLIGLIFIPWIVSADEPPLPLGLDNTPELPAGLDSPALEPALPSGLELIDEPPLPTGIDEEHLPPKVKEPTKSWQDLLPFDVSGFVEARGGIRTQEDPTQKDFSIGEGRWQLQLDKAWENLSVSVTSDFLYDEVIEEHTIDLERGEGWIDLREANVLYRASTFADIKLGRQTLTWGTGDLIFINDLFPKDWNSFFIGRDEEYLKAPSDALKVSFFLDEINIDAVYTPRFDNDRFIDGRRISYFNENAGTVVGRNLPVAVSERDKWFDEDEFALRLYRNVGAFETSFYAYWGYWKSPNGSDANSGLFIFPKLNVYGASTRGPVFSGIGNIEFGYYDSREDEGGDNALIRNSEFRVLVGYERELLPEFTGSVQYYLERMINHDAYLRTLPANSNRKDENRHVITLRLTKMMMNQNLTLSLFNFYSPSDEDGYLRPKINYKITDSWEGEIGGNIFYGSRNHTFFGQFEDNSNLYVALRYGF
jgi:hypothetical protein